MKAELIDPQFDGTIESLQEYLSVCASVVRDKDPKSPSKLWNRLLTESYGNTASSSIGFISKETYDKLIID